LIKWCSLARARGDARPDSDIDVLVVLRDKFDYREAIARTSELVARLSLENDLLISTVFISKDRYERGGSPFLLNVRREGEPV
jgi:predicted nucleotidyltransferase